MTGTREAQLIEAADQLLNARRTLHAIPDLPAELRPTSTEEVDFIQRRLTDALGAIGGWKVGAPSLEATPACAPMPQAWIAASGTTLAATRHRFRGLEAEIAFLLKADLPARATPYTDDEVYAAVASCHPALEILESGLVNPVDPAVRMSKDADLQMHGGLIYGPAYAEWRSVDFHQERVVLAVDGAIRVEAVGSNTSGNLLRLLPWLANQGAARTGGLFAGQWITTGSWTGYTLATSGSAADVHFSDHGRGRRPLRIARPGRGLHYLEKVRQMSDTVTGFRQVIQDSVAPELKSHSAKLDALQKQIDMTRELLTEQMKAMQHTSDLKHETLVDQMRAMQQSADLKSEVLIKTLEAFRSEMRSEIAVLRLNNDLEVSRQVTPVRERLAVVESRTKQG